MTYTLKWITFSELVKMMEESVKNQTGVPMQFKFELASDGNTDLYIWGEHKYSKDEITKLISLGWINNSIKELTNDPFEYDDELSLPNKLFDFILEKTFGKGAYVAGIVDTGDADFEIKLNIAVPA